jgi:hypothetical protein
MLSRVSFIPRAETTGTENFLFPTVKKLPLKISEFSVFHAAVMKVTVFWDDAPCSVAEIDRRFRCAFCLRHPDDELKRLSVLGDYTAQHSRSHSSCLFAYFQ